MAFLWWNLVQLRGTDAWNDTHSKEMPHGSENRYTYDVYCNDNAPALIVVMMKIVHKN